jgi:hypothetical protein
MRISSIMAVAAMIAADHGAAPQPIIERTVPAPRNVYGRKRHGPRSVNISQECARRVRQMERAAAKRLAA